MTPSQRINQIADELMALNKDLELQVALQNATITYLDEKFPETKGGIRTRTKTEHGFIDQ